MNIIISGSSGFIGSNLTIKWRDKHKLYGLDIRQPSVKGFVNNYNWCELQEITKVDAIVHLAGKAHDTKNQSVAQSYFDINTGLTKRIFDFFIRSDAKTFVFFSSVKAAADSVPGDVLTEDVVPAPVGPYGESKIKAEEYILNYMKRDPRAKEKNIYILRPCMIHGPGNKGNLNFIINTKS